MLTFRTWPVVALTFVAIVALSLLITMLTVSSIDSLRNSIFAVNESHRQDHLDALRLQIHVSSILVRDLLLDQDRTRAAAYRTKLVDSHNPALQHLADCPEPQRTAVYRIAQEALTNCARHARASMVRVELSRISDSLRLSVTDDGIGIATGHDGRRGFGLIGMEERVREFGGDLTIQSAPGQGTTVTVQVPTPGQKAHA